MTWFWELNLLHLFAFYLWVAFLASTVNRANQYGEILHLVRSVPGRWPQLFNLVKKHGQIFFTWTTVLPAILALLLSIAHMVACRVIFPKANLTVSLLGQHWHALPVVLGLGIGMLGVDYYAAFTVGKIDREEMQKYFDLAEFWLRSWTAPVVHIFTFGYVNPRKMVGVEVQKALIQASRLINTTLWWVTVQTGLRMAFGLSLWMTYVIGNSTP